MNDTRSDVFTRIRHFREVWHQECSLIVYYSCLLPVSDEMLDPVRAYAKRFCCLVASSDRVRDTEMMTGYARIVELITHAECPPFPHYCKHTDKEVPLV